LQVQHGPALRSDTNIDSLKCQERFDRVAIANAQRTGLGLVDAEMPGDGMDVQEPKDQQHDSDEAHEG
jgi:hypothetical protein